MSDSRYYLDRLYPLQNDVLRILEKHARGKFYLTGGTALSRFYFQHRYSDDLDFFSVKDMEGFRGAVHSLLRRFSDNGLVVEVESFSDTFLRAAVQRDAVRLKVDFVNEMTFRFGESKDFPLFKFVDNELNILANKLTAISRYEVKDLADIWVLSKHLKFSWRDIIDIANKKSPTDPLEVSKVIQSLPREELRLIKWVSDENPEAVHAGLQVIAEDVLMGRRNSLS